MMAQLGEWLDTIGVGRYAALLAEHDIDFQVLPELGEADLEKLGISLGHRKHALQYDADPGVTLNSYASWRCTRSVCSTRLCGRTIGRWRSRMRPPIRIALSRL